jgi:histidinol-phosphatase (PHP family)
MLVDYHVHLLGHADREGSEEDIRAFLDQALKKSIAEIAFTDHNRYYQDFNFELINKVAEEYPNLKVRNSVEMDYIPGRKKEIAQFLDSLDLDFVIASVHEIDGWMFDDPEYVSEYQKWDIDELYKRYFKLINKSVQSGLFDVIAHIDLIKIFGHRPKSDVVDLIEPTLELIAEKDLVIEVNTNGLNKKAAEIYPSLEILKKAYQLGVKVTMSSDAHHPQRVGESLKDIKELLLKIGYKKIAVFEDRKRKMLKL